MLACSKLVRWIGARSILALSGLLVTTACEGSAAPAEGPKPGQAPPEATPSPGAQAEPTPSTEPSAPNVQTNARTWTFDQATPGSIPDGVRVAETGGVGTPATWAVVIQPDAPTPPHAFGITKSTNGKPTYNLALMLGTSYGDVDVSVMVRSGTGELDRGGGPMWRVRDANNYYLARWNPLEHNARFYVVQDGVRTELAEVQTDLDPEAWHTLRVVMEGARMELFIDDEPVLRTEDERHAEPGMIGLWTKADAATLFDDLAVGEP